ncbi:RNA polymerase II transcription elongation factor-domain-containing protein [Aspergillus minisclerotigenes]|uniref:RNA polymerase II transcription elongation factor-domain-containing protein n=1 Tax=Aspergillus minisclerotigenes TaxID=656917 RepID=A0A5N6J095_9EURO|nr:RNA polymerase II transcription elongation factor-domain-containing protein [Aspergillus minisclerotigenes]
MAAPALSTGLIDPTKQAEYPIILGDRLSGKNGSSRSKLVNIQYNYKTKSATAQQTITRSSQSRDHYNLTITDKAPNAEQNTLTYSYQGSVDPDQAVSESEERNLVLVFDSHRKAFVLEPVAAQLNFNLRSAPAKTEKQVLEKYEQLRTLQEDDQGSGDDRGSDHANGNDDGPADDSNPYDFRHFLPKENADDDKSVSDNATPEPHYNTSKANTPLMPATIKPTPSPKPSPKPRPKTQSNPLRLPNPAKPAKHDSAGTPKTSSKPVPRDQDAKEKVPARDDTIEAAKSPSFENGSSALLSQQPAPSPGSNIIIDGDLIIDMGSPPPSRPAFRIDPAHFSSNNTPSNNEEDEDEDIEDLRLPSPAGHAGMPTRSGRVEPSYNTQADEDEVEDDDALAAEMEAAFEESAREEEARNHQSLHHYNAPSDDESEVSEEE